MLINLHSIIVDKPIPGLTSVTFNRCTTLADVLAAIITQGGADIHATGGRYDPATETIVIALSNGSTFTIPASLLLPVIADGVTITGNGTNANKLVGYQVAYDAPTGALTITPPTGAAVTVPAQTATEEKAADPHNLLGLGAGATVTTQQMLDYLAAHLRACCPSKTLEIPTTAFADPANPTQTEADAWINAQGALGPGTQIVYNRPGNPAADLEDPDYVWLVNEIGDATNVASPVLATWSAVADCRVPGQLLAADGKSYDWSKLKSTAIFGRSPLVLNPTTGIANWVLNQTESSAIATLTVTNPHPCRSLLVEVKVLHLCLARLTVIASPKTETFTIQSLISVDDGAGTLQLLPVYADSFGNSQLTAQATNHDVGANTNGGNQPQTVGILYVTIPPATARTFRARAALTVLDPHTAAVAWTGAQLAAMGVII